MLKISKIAFSLSLIISISGLVFLTAPKISLAADNAAKSLIFTPQVKIPGQDFSASTNVGQYDPGTGYMSSDLLAKYIKAFYNYGMSIAGILAALVLMGGGVLWLTSAGSESKVTQAKELIVGSVTGLAILFSSWIILNTINPDLLNMRSISLQIQRIKLLTPGLIDDITKLPGDTRYGWVCMDSADKTCADIDPPNVNLSHNICRNGGNSYNTRLDDCPYGLLWCCGQSATLTQIANSACQGKPNSTPCQPTITSTPTSGYCFDGKCLNEKVCCDCWKGDLNIGINNCKNDVTVAECLSDCTVPLGLIGAKPVYHPGGSKKYICEGAFHYCQPKP